MKPEFEQWADNALHSLTAAVPADFGGVETPKVPVAVVIVGRNYGRYLPDALTSVLQQDPAPAEVIYVDNASTDGSVQYALSRGVKSMVVGPQERHICVCRNRGLAYTSAPWLLFLDADDVIPQGYLGKLYEHNADPRVGIVYPQFSTFGLADSVGVSDFNDMYRSNYIAGQSLVRRRAIEAVGGYAQLQCFQDWDLWLRIINEGWLTAQAKVLYEHRTHADSLTSLSTKRGAGYQTVLRRQPITLFTPFGPGGPTRGADYFRTLEHLGVDWDRTTLFFYDNTGSTITADRLKGYLRDCPARGTIYYRDDTRVSFTDLHTRVEVVPERMAEIWTRMGQMIHTPFVLSLEHDMDPYLSHSAPKLYEGLAPDVDAVTGIYHSRPMVGVNRILALEWFARGDGSQSLRDIARFPGDLPEPPCDGATRIGATGVGYVLLRSDVIRNFTYPVGNSSHWCGQDFGLWRHVRERGKRLMAHWGVRLKHYHNAKEYV